MIKQAIYILMPSGRVQTDVAECPGDDGRWFHQGTADPVVFGEPDPRKASRYVPARGGNPADPLPDGRRRWGWACADRKATR